MATIEQLDDLLRFAKELPADELGALSVDDVYERWRSKHDDDVEAVRAALESFDRGERGRPIEEFLDEFRLRQQALRNRFGAGG